ncbi:hypothetical protein KM043_010162 [Ampulex compressa]|nr:hypothetical protein KM043_010162 [Ampulex compressa]
MVPLQAQNDGTAFRGGAKDLNDSPPRNFFIKALLLETSISGEPMIFAQDDGRHEGILMNQSAWNKSEGVVRELASWLLQLLEPP